MIELINNKGSVAVGSGAKGSVELDVKPIITTDYVDAQIARVDGDIEELQEQITANSAGIVAAMDKAAADNDALAEDIIADMAELREEVAADIEEVKASIPTGGEWVEVANITLENDVVEVKKDFPTNTYKESYIEAELKIVAPTQTTLKSTRFNVMRQGMFITSVWVNVKDGDTLYLRAKGWISPTKHQIYDVAAATYKFAYGAVNRNAGDMSSLEFDYLDKVIVASGANGVKLGTGSMVKIWGR